MKKIYHRLVRQFIGLLLAFSVVIAVSFGILFARQTEKLHLEEMLNRNERISETMAEYFADGTVSSKSSRHGMGMGSGNGMMSGYGAFLRFLNQIAGENVWVLNEKLENIINYHHQSGTSQAELPQKAQEVVTQVYQGEKAVVDRKQTLFQLEELTVGTPVIVDGVVQGVILTNSQINTVHANQMEGYWILLLSLLVAVAAAAILALQLSKRFVLPIRQMKNYVGALTAGNYKEPLSIETKDELHELGEQLTILSRRLEEAEQARKNKEKSEKEFLSQISHELRTPVMVIKSSLEAINDGLLDTGTEKEYLQQLQLEASALERLVTDLLELSRLESTEFQLQKEPFDIIHCLEDGVRSYRRVLAEKQQTVQLDIANELREKQRPLQGDYGRILQTIKILLDNANKYAPEGSTILLAAAPIPAGLEIRLSNVLAQPIAETAPLLQSFRRGRGVSETGGTGLGLAIAEQVIRRHGGALELATTEKQFEVRIQLPYSTETAS